MKRCVTPLAVLLLTLLTTACASPKIAEAPAEEFAAEGLHSVRSSGFETAYVHPDAGLAAYRVVDIESMNFTRLEIPQTAVSGTHRRDWQMTPEREQNLTEAWQNATGRTFSDYQPEGAAHETLRIATYLTRVSPGRSTGAAASASSVPVRGTQDVVDVSMEIRIYNGASDQLLAVVRDRQTIASLQWSGAAGVDIVNLFNRWAGMLHTRVSGR